MIRIAVLLAMFISQISNSNLESENLGLNVVLLKKTIPSVLSNTYVILKVTAIKKII